MLLDAWFAPPVILKRLEGGSAREESARRGPAPLLFLCYRPAVREPRFVCGLLPSGVFARNRP